jgi:peptidoglycan/xylan/chitin deacetylase (PgdA/CDA1 family)
MYLVKTPWLLKQLYPGLLWHADRSERSLYITFDDGPIPIVTPFVLNILQQYQAKATFFCIGDNVGKHPDVFEEVKQAGHALGNHTFNHLKGWKTESQAYLENFLKCDARLKSNLFRPPYGRIKREQVKLLQEAKPGLKIVMWEVLSGDFDQALKPEHCLKNVLDSAKPGSIIVFHDSLKAFPRLEYVLPRAMEVWRKEGYTFKALH